MYPLLVGKLIYDFYPRSPCGERPGQECHQLGQIRISIHALLAESDLAVPDAAKCPDISIHALLAESDGFSFQPKLQRRLFLSTLSLRRATKACQFSALKDGFLSTLSLRRATWAGAGGCQSLPHFYPRSPCGERRIGAFIVDSGIQFLSTLSLRRATITTHKQYQDLLFLSTLSLRRATWSTPPCKRFPYNFYPRSPCGERPIGSPLFTPMENFYPRSPCGERPAVMMCWARGQYFYPRSPCGERHLDKAFQSSRLHFYPRSPCGERPKRLMQQDLTIKFLSTLSLRRATWSPRRLVHR